MAGDPSLLQEEPGGQADVQATRGLLEERSRLEPEEPYWPYRLAAVCATLGIHEEAEIRSLDALEIDPFYSPALSLLSWIYYTTGRFEEGIVLLEEARDAGSLLSGELGAALALHYDAAGDPAGAARIADRYDRPGDHWRSVGPALVFVKLRGDNFERAARIAGNALGADPGSAANHNNYGITLLYEGNPLAARDSFIGAIDLDPDLPGSYYNLAIVEKFYLFNDEAAAKWFELYRKRSDDDPDALASYFAAAPPTERPLSDGMDEKESER